MAFRNVLKQDVEFNHPYSKKNELNDLLREYGINNQAYAYRISKIAIPDDVSFGPSYKEIQDRMSLILRLKHQVSIIKLRKYTVPKYLIEDIVREQQNKLFVILHGWEKGALDAFKNRLLSCLGNQIPIINSYEVSAIIGYLLNDKQCSYERIHLTSNEELVDAFNNCHDRVFKERYYTDLQDEINGVLVNTIELEEYCDRALSQQVLSLQEVVDWEKGIKSWCDGALNYMTIDKIVNEFELELLNPVNEDEPYRRFLVPQESLKDYLKHSTESPEYNYILGLSLANERRMIGKDSKPPIALAAQYLYYIISGNVLPNPDIYEEAGLIHDLLVLYGYLKDSDGADHKEKYDRVKRFFKKDKSGIYSECDFRNLIPPTGERYYEEDERIRELLEELNSEEAS